MSLASTDPLDMGAYLSPGAQGHIRNTTNCMTGVYQIPALYATYRIPVTNTTPIGAYRGAGRPDIAYAVESLVNRAAIEMGMDAAELRQNSRTLRPKYASRSSRRTGQLPAV
jgi:carbon-monoxide dehydrogenase large subunit